MVKTGRTGHAIAWARETAVKTAVKTTRRPMDRLVKRPSFDRMQGPRDIENLNAKFDRAVKNGGQKRCSGDADAGAEGCDTIK